MTEQTRRPRFWLWVVILTIADAVGYFVVWCLYDVCFVNMTQHAKLLNALGWLSLSTPFLIGKVDYWLVRHIPLGDRALLSIFATILAVPVGIVLVLWFGVPFHWSIGGQL